MKMFKFNKNLFVLRGTNKNVIFCNTDAIGEYIVEEDVLYSYELTNRQHINAMNEYISIFPPHRVEYVDVLSTEVEYGVI